MNRPELMEGPVIPADRVEHEPRAGSTADQPGTHLDPGEDFPAVLAELTLVELQVLHSRVCVQLDSEYLEVVGGAHPVTLDRHHELVAELALRESFLPVPADE